MSTEIMIDIETFDTAATAVIFQIGLVEPVAGVPAIGGLTDICIARNDARAGAEPERAVALHIQTA